MKLARTSAFNIRVESSSHESVARDSCNFMEDSLILLLHYMPNYQGNGLLFNCIVTILRSAYCTQREFTLRKEENWNLDFMVKIMDVAYDPVSSSPASPTQRWS